MLLLKNAYWPGNIEISQAGLSGLHEYLPDFLHCSCLIASSVCLVGHVPNLWSNKHFRKTTKMFCSILLPRCPAVFCRYRPLKLKLKVLRHPHQNSWLSWSVKHTRVSQCMSRHCSSCCKHFGRRLWHKVCQGHAGKLWRGKLRHSEKVKDYFVMKGRESECAQEVSQMKSLRHQLVFSPLGGFHHGWLKTEILPLLCVILKWSWWKSLIKRGKISCFEVRITMARCTMSKYITVPRDK